MSEEDLTKLEETASGEERIDEIVARYLNARESGSEPSVAEILARYPEYEKELREFFRNENFVREAFGPRDRPYFGDDYDVLEEIGRGGMGVVYEAQQISLQRCVALKVLPFAAAIDERQIQRFKNEALASGGSSGPRQWRSACGRLIKLLCCRFVLVWMSRTTPEQRWPGPSACLAKTSVMPASVT